MAHFVVGTLCGSLCGRHTLCFFVSILCSTYLSLSPAADPLDCVWKVFIKSSKFFHPKIMLKKKRKKEWRRVTTGNPWARTSRFCRNKKYFAKMTRRNGDVVEVFESNYPKICQRPWLHRPFAKRRKGDQRPTRLPLNATSSLTARLAVPLS